MICLYMSYQIKINLQRKSTHELNAWKLPLYFRLDWFCLVTQVKLTLSSLFLCQKDKGETLSLKLAFSNFGVKTIPYTFCLLIFTTLTILIGKFS